MIGRPHKRVRAHTDSSKPTKHMLGECGLGEKKAKQGRLVMHHTTYTPILQHPYPPQVFHIHLFLLQPHFCGFLHLHTNSKCNPADPFKC